MAVTMPVPVVLSRSDAGLAGYLQGVRRSPALRGLAVAHHVLVILSKGFVAIDSSGLRVRRLLAMDSRNLLRVPSEINVALQFVLERQEIIDLCPDDPIQFAALWGFCLSEQSAPSKHSSTSTITTTWTSATRTTLMRARMQLIFVSASRDARSRPHRSSSSVSNRGLIPCPAAITVLLLCIQLKQFTLGFALVLCFGIGLAITMVSAGVLAALSLRHVEQHWRGFNRFAHRAPYVSAGLIILVGLYTGWIGLHEIMA